MAEQQNIFWKKCMDGRVEEVRGALAAGADPNSTGGAVNMTCLMVATTMDHDAVVDLLLSQPDIQVNAKDTYKRTALHVVCSSSVPTIFDKILAESQGMLNERDNNGFTPIMYGIQDGYTDNFRKMASVPEVDLDVKTEQGLSLEDLANRLAGDAGPAIVQVLEEARQNRRMIKLIKEQKVKVKKVLGHGLHDEGSILNKLRMPAVGSPIMKIIWDKICSDDWQVFNDEDSTA